MSKIKQLRLSKGITQQQLANLLGVKRTTVTMWENGGAFPQVDRLLPLANILETTVPELLESKQRKAEASYGKANKN
jgi:transcriptional regulator with XRE-family HTH domain